VEGDVTLRITDGSERYVPLGECLPIPVAAGEYSYCDDSNEVLCRLEVRQVNKTATTPRTTKAFFIVQGNDATPDSYVEEAAQRLVDEITRYAGGSGRVVMPQTR
jgi:DNA/RNA-binding domain of Phe-tRNA-synthetase-like protein